MRVLTACLTCLAVVLPCSGDALASPGDLDPTFAGDGTQTVPFPAKFATSAGVAVGPGGAIAVTGQVGDGFGLALFTPDGQLDARFSSDGRLSNGFMVAHGLAFQRDGRIVVAGGVSGDQKFGVASYRRDGTADQSFSADGRVSTAIKGAAVASGVVVQGDGRIVVGGQAEGLFALVRYRRNGSLDRSFGRRGILTTSVGPVGAFGAYLAPAPGGKFVLAGSTEDHSGRGLFIVARYTHNGSLDRSFSGDGRLTTALGLEARAYGVAVQADGKILVTGTAGGNAVIVRYTSAGAPDLTFGAAGKISLRPLPEAEASGVAVQADGDILVAIDGELVRLRADGTVDALFGTNGKAAVDMGVIGIALQPDGRIVTCGTGRGNGFTSTGFGVARFLGG
jgi:uncharacterized delta-60 repeat protein